MSYVAQNSIEIVKQRVRYAVLRHQAGLPQLHDPVALLESVDGLIADYERRIERLEEEVAAYEH